MRNGWIAGLTAAIASTWWKVRPDYFDKVNRTVGVASSYNL